MNEPTNSAEWTERLTDKIEDAYMMLHDIPMSAQVEVGNKIRELLNRAIAERDAEIARLANLLDRAKCPKCGFQSVLKLSSPSLRQTIVAHATNEVASLRQQLLNRDRGHSSQATHASITSNVCPVSGDPSDPAFDPEHKWTYDEEDDDGTPFYVCARCGKVYDF